MAADPGAGIAGRRSPRRWPRAQPGEGYPYHWAIRRWLDGETASLDDASTTSTNSPRSIAEFILALQRVDATGGPDAGAHSFYRGAPPEYYHDETHAMPSPYSKGRIDTDLAREVWDAALATTWDRPPVWFHGDIASGNLLVQDGRLSAVIDFGTSGVGDPACDLVIAWTFFSGGLPRGLPARGRPGRRHVGPRPRLGPLEGPHHARHRPDPRSTTR